jgi:hypothetical protein
MVSKQVSDGREFVATLKVGVCDPSSQVRNHWGPRRLVVAGMENQAHANQVIDISGAVKTLASSLPVCAAETEVPACSMQPRNQRNQTPAQSVLIAGLVRFARLCVLI